MCNQYVCLLPAFSNRQLSPTMANSSQTCARFYTMVPQLYGNPLLVGFRQSQVAYEHAFVSIVACDSIDIPAQTICCTWTDLHDLYQRIAQKHCTKYVKMGLSYRKLFALLALQASQKFWVHMYVDEPQTEPIEVLILITPKG